MKPKSWTASHPLIATFSIVAADPDAKQVGVAVQSKYFAVGAVVPWVRSGVGAVATQARGLARYGKQLLDALTAGENPQSALDAALEGDELAPQRQIGLVNASGNAANHTGDECLEWAGARSGPGFSAQGNLLAGEEVVEGMAKAFENTKGSLAERLMAALEAGQAAGGDRRGQQSAALLVEQQGFADIGPSGIDRLVDLRVDDHPQATQELRRLFDLWQIENLSLQALLLYNETKYAAAAEMMAEANRKYPDQPRILYNLACFECLSGHEEDSLVHLKKAADLDSTWREFAKTDSDFDAVRDKPAFISIISTQP